MEHEGLFRIHKSPPPVPILSHINPLHAPPSHFLKIDFNIIIPARLKYAELHICLLFCMAVKIGLSH
jgi:hypothetical protein